MTYHPPERTDENWIQTFTGRQFWPLNPRVEDICIEDIAHALSLKCRYTGHCREFYSVAQHCVITSAIVPPADALCALMHDATEAYLPDVARPVKRQMPDFRAIEDNLHRAIAERFCLPWPMPESIDNADYVLLVTERRDLLSTPPARWWRRIEETPALPEPIEPLSPQMARDAFLMRFAILTGESVQIGPPDLMTVAQTEIARARLVAADGNRAPFDRLMAVEVTLGRLAHTLAHRNTPGK